MLGSLCARQWNHEVQDYRSHYTVVTIFLRYNTADPAVNHFLTNTQDTKLGNNVMCFVELILFVNTFFVNSQRAWLIFKVICCLMIRILYNF